MYGKLRKNMGFSLIIFAFFFLFEPSCALVDPLPDCIGYSILCFALINLADINDRISYAFRAFRRGILLSILRIVCLILLDKVFVDDEQTVGLLLFVFVFALFELLIMIPGYKALFDGLQNLGIFEGGEAVYHKKHEKGRNASEKMYIMTLVFLIVKNLFSLVPELTTLKSDTSYEFIYIVRILFILITLPFSLTWLINIVRYFVKVRRDTPFVKALEEKYISRSQASPEFFVGRVIRVGLASFLVSFILTFNLYSEGVNYLPNAFAYSTLLATAIFMRRFSGKWRHLAVSSVIGAVCSICLFYVEKYFYEMYYIGAVNRNIEAHNHYYFMLALYIIQSIIFVAVLIFSLMFLYDIFIQHFNREASEHDAYKIEDKRKFSIKLYTCLSMGILYALSSVYHIFSLPRSNWSWVYRYSGIISTAITIMFIASAAVLISHLQDKIKKIYKTTLL